MDYWDELCRIMDYTKENVYSTIHLCWGALAGLYYHFGVPKVHLGKKMFGVFEHRVTRPPTRWCAALMRCSTPRTAAGPGWTVPRLTPAPICGFWPRAMLPGRCCSPPNPGGRFLSSATRNMTKYTLDKEYKRDVKAGKPINIPCNYYPNDDPSRDPLFRWRAHGYLLYTNWLNYYVYQDTPL